MRLADIGHLDLDLPKAPSKTRVVVAMSGGVDSSVTAGDLIQLDMMSSGSRCSFMTMGWRLTAKALVVQAKISTMPGGWPINWEFPITCWIMKKNFGNPSSIILQTVIYRGKPPFLAFNATVR